MSRPPSQLRHIKAPHRHVVAPDPAAAGMFRQALLLVVLAAALAVAMPLRAATPTPEIQRPVGSAQAIGAVHTVRQIPEACVRLEGRFGENTAAMPYALRVVPLGGKCQPRARYLGADQVGPALAGGWILNDVIRVPQAGCAGREAVVQVWRKAGTGRHAPDGQGQNRVYLEQGEQQAAAAASSLPQYSARLQQPASRCD
jgi:hypothetical protein